MHEFSIVQSLFDLLEQYAAEHRAKRVLRVKVKLGQLSGIEPHLLKVAFDTFKEKTIADSAQIEIEVEKLSVQCRQCNKKSALEEMILKCPACNSLEVEIAEGEDMLLESLELDCNS